MSSTCNSCGSTCSDLVLCSLTCCTLSEFFRRSVLFSAVNLSTSSWSLHRGRGTRGEGGRGGGRGTRSEEEGGGQEVKRRDGDKK